MNRTAMSIISPSSATRKLVTDILANGKFSMPVILDYGAGNGRNSCFISTETNAFVIAYDPHPHKKPLFPILNKPDGFGSVVFDYILCSFVANTLPREARELMYEDIYNLTYRNLIIEVRTIADVDKIKHKTRFSDGYNTKKGFQKGFEPADLIRLEDFFGDFGQLFTKKHHAISFIWRDEL